MINRAGLNTDSNQQQLLMSESEDFFIYFFLFHLGQFDVKAALTLMALHWH